MKNKIHELNTIFLLLVIERFSSAIEYSFNEMVELGNGICDVERLKSKFNKGIGEKEINLNSKVISRDFI
jgi:hypothetical protein